MFCFIQGINFDFNLESAQKCHVENFGTFNELIVDMKDGMIINVVRFTCKKTIYSLQDKINKRIDEISKYIRSNIKNCDPYILIGDEYHVFSHVSKFSNVKYSVDVDNNIDEFSIDINLFNGQSIRTVGKKYELIKDTYYNIKDMLRCYYLKSEGVN